MLLWSWWHASPSQASLSLAFPDPIACAFHPSTPAWPSSFRGSFHAPSLRSRRRFLPFRGCGARSDTCGCSSSTIPVPSLVLPPLPVGWMARLAPPDPTWTWRDGSRIARDPEVDPVGRSDVETGGVGRVRVCPRDAFPSIPPSARVPRRHLPHVRPRCSRPSLLCPTSAHLGPSFHHLHVRVHPTNEPSPFTKGDRQKKPGRFG
eukprot:scaffold810_cov355-Pavlova_lutheri.AAC.29